LFEAPTVFGLAQAVELTMQAGDELPTLPIKRVSREEPQERLPLSYAQQRLWFIDEMAINKAAYNVPGAVGLQGVLNVTALEQTLGEIIRRHETLRTVFVFEDGQPFQVVTPNWEFKLPLVELSDLPAGERENVAVRLAFEEAERPFDLRTGPLLRVSSRTTGPWVCWSEKSANYTKPTCRDNRRNCRSWQCSMETMPSGNANG
jgi:hypothetical protein